MLPFLSCQEKKTLDTNVPADDLSTTEAPIDTVNTERDTVPKSADFIADIREKVEAINTTELKQKHYEFMCGEKMQVDYFYKDEELVKISVDFGTVGDVYAKEDYYYDAGKLLFVYEFVEGGPACEGCIKKNEYRSYVVNDKTVKYLKDKTQTDCKKCSFNAKSREYKLLFVKSKDEVKQLFCR